jgi:senataxin
VVPDFLNKVDKLCNERITAGLDEANRVLSAVEPKQRSVRILPNEATYAFFEALSCDAFIRNEELMQRHFDQPFQFVQTKKRLKLQIFLPAMTQFLFSKNEERQTWGILSWTGSKRNILLSEFDWTVRDHLVNAMMRVQTDNLDQAFLGTFWQGVKLIVAKLDKELISHSIRGLDGNFYKLILDHLWLNSEGFLDLVTTMTMLLEKAPTDFWDAMGAVTPRTETIVEQFFKSPILRKLLLAAGDDSEEQQRYLNDAFAWILPFLRSLKPQNLTPVCKAFANFFLDHAQSEPFPKAAKVRCFKECLGVLDYSFRKMNEGKTVESFVGQPNVNGMLTVLSGYIKPIVAKLSGPGQLQPSADIRQLVVSIVLQAFTLECQSLAVERYLISRDKPSPTEPLPSSPIWKAILEAVDADSIDLATNLLVAGRNLIGLEPLHMKTGVKEIPPAVRRFNERFELLSRSVTNVIDRLAEFDPAQLDALLEQPAASSAIISSLFSSTIDTRNSSVELLKVISAQDERRDALQHVLKAYYKNVLKGVSNSCRQITDKKAFAAAPGVVKTCTDIIDVMCNSQDGILRSRSLDTGEAGVTMNLWKSLWDTLSTIFQTTEAWSNLGFYNKTTMMDFCRDTMQFADQLFDQYSIFSTALKEAGSVDETSGDELMKELLAMPAKTMQAMAGWLRLRDEFLSSKSVTLISKLLVRLRQVSVEVDDQALSYMEKVVSGDVRAKLSMQQMAELIRALETYVGHSLAKTEEPIKQSKQGTLAQWASTSTVSAGDRARGHEAARGTTLEKMLAAATPAARAFQDNREARRVAEAKSARLLDKQKEDYQSEFKKKRQAEQERLKKEREAAKARAQKNRGVPSHLAEAGSGLEGLGILGKDRAEKGEGLMHSSDESEDEDGDIDEELFGIKTEKKVRTDPKTNIIDGIKIQMPTKKRKVQRSSMDMRARLAPDLSSLHRTILGWDYFHNGDFPPKSSFNYTKVPGTFRTPTEYQNTFEPLLVLEAWQGFVKAREENTLKPFEIRVVSRASVDAFQEVGSTMTHKENSDVGRISEGDIVLLSQTGSPSVEDRYCLARVFRTQRKQAHYEVSYRVMPGTSLQPALVPNGTVYGTKIQSITPLEREFGALVGLQFYDLCDEIIHAKPSPLLTYKDNQLDPLSENYNLNKAQARAVKSAIDNDAFTLIQGYVSV